MAVKVGGDPSEIESHLKHNVEGHLVALTNDMLSEFNDSGRIRKVYRLEGPKDELLSKEAEAFVLGSMALKGS